MENLIRIVYHGKPGQHVQIGGAIFLPEVVYDYRGESSLPLPRTQLYKLGFSVNDGSALAEGETAPLGTVVFSKPKKVGLVWKGGTVRRITEHGIFVKDVPVFGISEPTIKELIKANPNFERIEV